MQAFECVLVCVCIYIFIHIYTQGKNIPLSSLLLAGITKPFNLNAQI